MSILFDDECPVCGNPCLTPGSCNSGCDADARPEDEDERAAGEEEE